MRVAVTGTPGTGKTTATDLVETELSVVHLNEVVHERGFTVGHDERRDSAVVDTDAVASWLADREDVLFESHLAHRFPADRVVVLRCHPATLSERLAGSESPDSVAENAESETLDIVLAEAVERHGEGCVYEIDTTDRAPAWVAAAIESVVDGKRDPAVGTVSFLGDR